MLTPTKQAIGDKLLASRTLTACSRTIAVPHPFAFFLAKGWESPNSGARRT
jgi:hypothetical protein